MKNIFKRKIVLDTETTGIDVSEDLTQTHRIIEIGAVEIINRKLTGNNFHTYLNPNRLIDPEAFKIHGISNKFLLDKPYFKNISNDFIEYIYKSELIIHNASFDVKFIENELKISKFNVQKIRDICHITDTLNIARMIFPGKKNTLDILCNRFNIKNEKRKLHSALLDAKLLAQIYLKMTRKQKTLLFAKENDYNINKKNFLCLKNKDFSNILLLANSEEIDSHNKYLKWIKQKSKKCFWKF